jgi:hypothetical protein
MDMVQAKGINLNENMQCWIPNIHIRVWKTMKFIQEQHQYEIYSKQTSFVVKYSLSKDNISMRKLQKRVQWK